MKTVDKFGFRSTAAVADHPLHPLLITLPVGFLIAALLSDLGFFAAADAFWARASAWLIGAGLVGGALAAAAGFTDFFGNRDIQRISLVWFHLIGNAIALVVAAINLYLRLAQAGTTVTGTELILSIVVVAIFAVTGWLGGEMVFRHGVGMIAPSAAAGDRLPVGELGRTSAQKAARTVAAWPDDRGERAA
jgi:uncharacterized membrane protein